MPDPGGGSSETVEWLDVGQRAGAGGLPFGAAVLQAGRVASGDVVLLSSGQVCVDPAGFPVVASVLATTDRATVALVPRVLRTDGSLAEAGAMVVADGAMVSCGTGESPQRSEHQFSRVVDGTRFGCLAIRRSFIAQMSLDAELDDPDAVMADVLGQLRDLGQRIVFEPRWSVVTAQPCEASPVAVTGPHRTAMRDARMEQRILLVTGSISGRPTPWADAGIMDLLGALNAACPRARLVVACAEALGGHHTAAHLRAAGVEVAMGPVDWGQWFDDRKYHFSHAVVSDAALLGGLGRYAIDTQPQAAKILWTSSLPFRAVEGMLPVTPHGERVGHEHVRAAVAVRTSDVIRHFDSVWCGTVDDHQYLSGLLSDVPVRLLSRPISDPPAERGHGERWGMAVLAVQGADIVAANEDAAISAAEEIFGLLHRRDRQLRLTVITDGPSPMVERLATLPGVELANPGRDGGLGDLARARLVLAPYRHGLGGVTALRAALTARTPVLTTPYGARGVLLGDLAPLATVDDLRALAERAWSLHGDAEAWDHYRTTMDGAIRTFHGRSHYHALVAEALLELGVAPPVGVMAGPRLDLTAPGGYLGQAGPVHRGRPLAIRPGETPSRVTTGVPDGVPEVDGYRLWCETRGPTPAVLERLRNELDSMDHHPKISIITPVYNTDATVLEATLASVHAQIYENWELCLADDGSTRPETREVVERATEDPRVQVLYLPGQSGIAGASNAAASLASGDYVTLLDHDDLLKPHALAQVVRWLNHDPTLDVVYSDEDKLNEVGQLVMPFLKPDWSPNLLMTTNYICHLLVVRKSLFDKVGGFRLGFDGSQDHDLVLRLTEETQRIAHIPEPLYTWRMVPGSAAAVPDAKPYAFEAAKKALREALERRGQPGTVGDGALTGIYRTRYAIPGRPRVAIIIPTRDKVDLLRRCIGSVVDKTTYQSYEIVVIDNGSREPATLEYLAAFPGRVVKYPETFNYARMMNLAAFSVDCDAMLFLNNDTEVINDDWMDALLEHGMRPEVGAVGARLYYPDGRPQHEGIFVGVMGTATNVDHRGFWGLGDMTRDFSAVTGACVMIRPGVYWAVGGNDERLRVAYNDVDICLRIHQAGYQVVYTPYAELVHFEGASRAGYEHDDDKEWFTTRWRQAEEWDPYYNPNYDRGRLFRIAL
jgi:GT2 family glycosyltransferase